MTFNRKCSSSRSSNKIGHPLRWSMTPLTLMEIMLDLGEEAALKQVQASIHLELYSIERKH